MRPAFILFSKLTGQRIEKGRYKTIKDQHQVNGEIRDQEVRVIGSDGNQLGIMSAREALRLAEESDLDLVKISANTSSSWGKRKKSRAKIRRWLR